MALDAWQRRLLPLMGSMLVLLSIFFVAESVLEVRALQKFIQDPKSGFSVESVTAGPGLAAELRARFALEGYALAQRERATNYMLATRVWTRYMSFCTGMVLALVGAAFVLGKLQESPITLGAESVAFKVSLAASSPGLVLATLGTMLMVSANVVTFDVRGDWRSAYLPTSVDERYRLDSSKRAEPAVPTEQGAATSQSSGSATTPRKTTNPRAHDGRGERPLYQDVLPTKPK
jgi:hypothetical protein